MAKEGKREEIEESIVRRHKAGFRPAFLFVFCFVI
jgi:hypothetical protein